MAAAFGVQLRELRVRRELSQERLAEITGVHRTFVSNLERGYRVPTLVTIIRMADALEVRLGELLDAMETSRDTWSEGGAAPDAGADSATT